jgi:hypothetical protein
MSIDLFANVAIPFNTFQNNAYPCMGAVPAGGEDQEIGQQELITKAQEGTACIPISPVAGLGLETSEDDSNVQVAFKLNAHSNDLWTGS